MADGAGRQDIDAVVTSWAAAGCHLDEASRRAVVAAVVHALDGRGSSSWIDALYRFDPTLSISVDDASSLRVALHDRLVTPRPPTEAIELQHRLGVLIDELVAAAAQRRLQLLEQTAMVDPLTGLLNRRGFDATFASTLAQSRRHSRGLALAMVDLDGLKRINDTSGHAAGDEALRGFAAATTKGLRAGDNAFRIGGDEFVILAPDTTAAALAMVMHRIAEDAPAFSVGIAEMPTDGDDAAAILAVADARLYGTRSAEAAALVPPLIARTNVGLVALALASFAALAAELVRRAVGAEATGTTAAAWQLILATAPLGCAIAAGWRGPTTAVDAVRRGSTFAAISLLAMIATMTPLFVRTAGPEGARQWLAGGPLTSPTTTVAPRRSSSTPSSTPAATTTTTTTLPPSVATDDVAPIPTARAVELDTELIASPVQFSTPKPPSRPTTTTTIPPVGPIVPGAPTAAGSPTPVANGHTNEQGEDDDDQGEDCSANPNASTHANNGNGRDGQEVRCLPTPRRRDPIPGPHELVPDPSPSFDAPGNSGNAPGHSGDAPGNSANAPGHNGGNGRGNRDH